MTDFLHAPEDQVVAILVQCGQRHELATPEGHGVTSLAGLKMSPRTSATATSGLGLDAIGAGAE